MQLISWLAYAGARDADGDPVSTGTAWFYEIGGGSTNATIYSDAAGTIATQPVTLDAGGRAAVYVGGPVRILIQDATGADVSDQDEADVIRAESVQVENSYFSDGYLDGVLTAIGESVGGENGMYLESGGATPRTIQDKFSELSVSVKDFGAQGNGLAIDTTAIQAAINRVGFLGGGEVYFPPGTYLVDQTLTNSIMGVSLRGASATLQNTNATQSLFSFSGATYFSIRDLTITGGSTGSAIVLSTATQVAVSGVVANGHRTGIVLATAGQVVIDNCRLSANDGSVNSRSISITGGTGISITSTYMYGGTTGKTLECAGASGSVSVVGCTFDTVGVLFAATLSGTGFSFTGNTFTNTTPNFTFSGATMPKGFYQRGNGIDGYAVGLLSGGTLTPDLSQGWTIFVNATTTGGAYTINVPTPPPAATDYGVYMDIVFYAHAGAPITGWGLAAGYHTDAAAAAPSTVDTNRTAYRFWWDPGASVWRQVQRSVTT